MMTTTAFVNHWIPKLFKESFQRTKLCPSINVKRKGFMNKRTLATFDQAITSSQLKVTWLESQWTFLGTKGKCDGVVDNKGRLVLEFTPVEDSLCYKVHYGRLELPCSWQTSSKSHICIDNWKPEVVYRVQIFTMKRDVTSEQLIFQGKLLLKHSTTTVAPKVSLQDASMLEIRVGKILSCKKHPNADTLLVEEIDIGEDNPRTIVSGLVKHYEPEQLVSRKVLVLCNLKAKKMRGIESKGMLLCGSTKDKSKVEPLSPPEHTQVGELVYFDGVEMKPTESGKQATQSFERIVDFLKTDSKGVALLEVCM
ncbi:methionyl-tRNA synthetase isoform 2 [Galdieria sulphuraria]|uniref:Methionyl-tRNA synthetase isoform 2 n=1 Tax=Galdieria sulphuraria TaxID=130081 RepID=M2Y4C6_GALSU|nr:methionyl-tRNA synthetase isoform 2 [Galdieria sulphuraria]EME30689.1 methionyl-tRNA synthetase isoform 2 [Galdieria sulphuraria]|eukprot:XP_005707209.1 methionyl-tRNA synthetase isoform 2 [Galdieria sulphuraria]